MTSQVSTRKLLKLELRRNGWMLGLTTLLHLLTGPVVLLLYISAYDTWTTNNTINRLHNFFRQTYLPWQLFAMIVCITMCIAIYRFLFSGRMMDLYHSAPLSRKQLFGVKYLHGLFVWLVPFCINFVSVALFVILRLLGTPGLSTVMLTMLKCFFLILVCYFIFYHLFLVAVYLSGNILNMFANVAIIGLSIIGLWYLFFGFASCFFDTYCYTPPDYMTDLMLTLSPFAAPFGIYANFANGSLFSDHFLLVALSLLLSILLLILAHHLYRIRPSELAERGTLLKSYTIPARFVTTLILGTAGSLFFSQIADTKSQLIWGIFGSILCSVLGSGFLNSVFHANIKAFFRNRFQLMLVTALSTFFVLSMQLDLFGYDTYLPDEEDIAGIAIYTHSLSDGSATYISILEDGSLIQTEDSNQHVLQEELFTDKALCYDLLSAFIYTNTDHYQGNNTHFYTKVMLENGRTYTRYYKLPDSLCDKLAPFIEDDGYKAANYKFSTGVLGYPDMITYSLWDYSVSGKLDANTIQRLMEAYWLDFEEHYTLEELSNYLYVGEIGGRYSYGTGANTRQFSLRIHANYARTLAVLQELMPESLPAAKGPEDIQDIYLYAPSMPADINALYEHFGYTRPDAQSFEAANDTSAEAAMEDDWEDGPVSHYSADASYIEIVEIETTQATTADSMELTLHDEASIAELYPLLYYGNYRDLFGQDDYISIGHITTVRGYTVGIYVKPGTLPPKYIEQLYETRQEYDFTF